MKNFLLIVNTIKGEAAFEVCKRIENAIEKKGGTWHKTTGFLKKDEVPEGTECAIVLGGDGTLLHASKDLIDFDIPLVGVNFGHLGFLADVEADSVEQMVDRLMADDYAVEERMMLEATVTRGGKEVFYDSALNDIVIGRSGVMAVIDFKLLVNGIRLNSYKADGIIAATPTGSTAYSMSAGGPLVKPSAQLIVMTPVCPHTLNTRSVVLDKDDVIEIEICQSKLLETDESGYVYFDGDRGTPLYNGDIISIKKSKNCTKVIKLDSRSFLEVLRRKLNNNEDSQT